MMSENVNKRILSLREVMRRERLNACVFTSGSPHGKESVADYWKRLEWISGFTGTAGTAVVTMQSAVLFTDESCYSAAEKQLVGTDFKLVKLDLPIMSAVCEWIGQEMCRVSHPYCDWHEVAIDGMCCSVNEVRQLINGLRRKGGITVRINFDALSPIWYNRPPLPKNKIDLVPREFMRETTGSKLERIRNMLRAKHADGMLISSIQDIAWALNLCGSGEDVGSPFVGYLLLSTNRTIFFVNREVLSPNLSACLKSENIVVDDYMDVKVGLKNYFEYNIFVDPDEMNYTLYKVVSEQSGMKAGVRSAVKIVEGLSPIPFLRGC